MASDFKQLTAVILSLSEGIITPNITEKIIPIKKAPLCESKLRFVCTYVCVCVCTRMSVTGYVTYVLSTSSVRLTLTLIILCGRSSTINKHKRNSKKETRTKRNQVKIRTKKKKAIAKKKRASERECETVLNIITQLVNKCREQESMISRKEAEVERRFVIFNMCYCLFKYYVDKLYYLDCCCCA